MATLDKCYIEWDTARGVIYVHSGPATVIRITGIPPVAPLAAQAYLDTPGSLVDVLAAKVGMELQR